MSLPRIETLAIGDELLTGRTTDTNTTFVGDRLFRRGLRLSAASVILDDDPSIESALEAATRRSDLLVVFGGLGPTTDDRTVDAVARWLGTPARIHEPSRQRMEQAYRERGREVTAEAVRQVRYPGGTLPLDNPVGLAPGFRLERNGCVCFFLPGVPKEMGALVNAHVLPEAERLAEAAGVRLHWKTWKCIGIPESELQRQVAPEEAALPEGMWLGFRTRFPENHLTLYSRGDGGERFAEKARALGRRVAPWCYSDGEEDLEDVVVNGLRRRNWRVSLAESCTSGLVVHRLTNVPDASRVVWGGAAVYQIQAKAQMLGVDLEDPRQAVSADCTRRLAESIRALSGTEVAAAVTGYMGPAGGDETDPVGTFYYCVVAPGKRAVEGRMVLPPRGRKEAQWGTASFVLNAIRIALEEEERG